MGIEITYRYSDETSPDRSFPEALDRMSSLLRTGLGVNGKFVYWRRFDATYPRLDFYRASYSLRERVGLLKRRTHIEYDPENIEFHAFTPEGREVLKSFGLE